MDHLMDQSFAHYYDELDMVTKGSSSDNENNNLIVATIKNYREYQGVIICNIM